MLFFTCHQQGSFQHPLSLETFHDGHYHQHLNCAFRGTWYSWSLTGDHLWLEHSSCCPSTHWMILSSSTSALITSLEASLTYLYHSNHHHSPTSSGTSTLSDSQLGESKLWRLSQPKTTLLYKHLLAWHCSSKLAHWRLWQLSCRRSVLSLCDQTPPTPIW